MAHVAVLGKHRRSSRQGVSTRRDYDSQLVAAAVVMDETVLWKRHDVTDYKESYVAVGGSWSYQETHTATIFTTAIMTGLWYDEV